ncbi:retrovirus-related pol polyprotein from transposon TNT 1-94 [Tanacetum coccineum]
MIVYTTNLPIYMYLHVFGALCYPTNDSENLGKLQPKADIGIFIGYAPTKKAFRIYNRRTKRIIETIHVDFDELTAMASEHSSSGPALHEMTPVSISSGLVPNPPSSTPFVPPSRSDWDLLFQPILHIWDNDPELRYSNSKVPSDQSSSSFVIPYKWPPDHQPKDLDNDNPNHVCKLKKALYGLKQAPRSMDLQWVEKSKLDKDIEGKAIDPSHYHGMIGTLLYLTTSRPDQQFAICMCAWYQARPTEKHLNAVTRIFRYLKGTVHRGLWYPKDSSIALTAFADADHAGCQDTRRSTSGSMQLLSDRLLTDYGFGFNKIPMYCDNKSAIALCGNNVQHSRSKHIDIRFHFIKEHVKNGVIELYFVNTEYQLADIFTKALGRKRIEFLINKLGMRSFTPETLKQLADEVDE